MQKSARQANMLTIHEVDSGFWGEEGEGERGERESELDSSHLVYRLGVSAVEDHVKISRNRGAER